MRTASPRAGYDAIPLYAPATGGGEEMPCAVDASDTVNLWGAPPDAVAAFGAAATSAMLATYPALYNAELKAPLAAYAGVEPDALMTGCGSDDVIDCALRAFAEPGGVVAHAAPTFSMVPAYTRANGMTPVGVPLTGDDYTADADALLATGAAVIYLCSPNNPTSTALARATVERVVAGARGLVIVDEAYAEYVLADARVGRHAGGEVFTPEAPGWGRVLATRTLSKAFGLAGLRVGYGVGHPDVVRAVEKARGPFKVTFPAEAAVRAALGAGDGGLGWVRAHAGLAVVQRDRLVAGLRALGLAPAPSTAHFVFVPVADARGVAGRLRARHGVGVRVFDALPTAVPALRASGGAALRLNVGPDDVQARVLAALGAELGAEIDTARGAGGRS